MTPIFQVIRQDDTIVVEPQADLDELAYQQIESGAKEILALLEHAPIKNVVVDFHKTDYYGSSALGFFVKLWKRVRQHRGGMAFCCVSAHEKDILQVTKLDQLWLVCKSRQEALAAVTKPVPD
jgi:anti-anti-sigma factor